MSQKMPRVNPLQLQKELLVAESELNRAQLAGDLTALTADFRAISDRAKSFGSLASSVAVLVAGLAAFRYGKPLNVAAKRSWPQTILKGAGLISTLWLAFRAPERNREDR